MTTNKLQTNTPFDLPIKEMMLAINEYYEQDEAPSPEAMVEYLIRHTGLDEGLSILGMMSQEWSYMQLYHWEETTPYPVLVAKMKELFYHFRPIIEKLFVETAV